jgi:transposase-like protein
MIAPDHATKPFETLLREREHPSWHLDEEFVKVNGKLCYLWRAVDHEGEVLGLWSPRGGTRLRR